MSSLVGENEFAVRLSEKELSGWLSKEVQIDEGCRGLLLANGKYDRSLEPGRHHLGNIWALRKERLHVILVKSGDFPLNFCIDRLLTKDPLFVQLDCVLALRLRPGVESVFVSVLMSGKDTLAVHDLRALLYEELKDVAQAYIARHSVWELAENLELKKALGYEMEAGLEQSLTRYGLSFSGLALVNLRCEGRDRITQRKVDVYLQVSQQEAELQNKKRLFDVYSRSEVEELAQETAKVANFEKRAQVWDRMRRAFNAEAMNRVTSEKELEDFMRQTDRDRILKEADFEDFKRALAAQTQDKERARAHLSRLAEMERDFDLKRVDLNERHDLSRQQVEADIGLERLKMEWQREIELKKVDLEVESQRRRLELPLEVEDRRQALALARERERQQAQLEAKGREQRLELERQEAELNRRLAELRARHQMELEKAKALDGLSLHGLIAVSSEERVPLLAELARTQAMKDLSPEQILALAAERSPELGQSLAELARAASSPEEKQFYERLLAEQKESAAQMRETYREFSKTQQEMFQKALETQAEIAKAFGRGGVAPLSQPTPAESPPQRVIVCRRCHQESPVGTKHCPNCGDSLLG